MSRQEEEPSPTVPETQTLVPYVPPSAVFVCKKCEREVSEKDVAPAKSKWDAKTCRPCHNLETMIGKHMGAKNFREILPAEQQVSFFREVLSSSEGSALRFKNVRAHLTNRLRMDIESSWSSGSTGTFQPLSYWANQGYTEDQLDSIQKKAERKEHDVLGTVYCLDIDQRSESEVYRNVEEKIVQCERDVKRKSALPYAPPPKKNKKDQPTPIQDLSEDQKAEKQLLCLDLTGMESEAKQRKALSKHTKNADKEAKKLEKAAQKEQERFTTKMGPLVAKCISSLKTVLPKLEKAQHWISKDIDGHVPHFVAESVAQEIKELKEWEVKCTEAMKLNLEGKLLEVGSLPFENDKDLKLKIKAANNVVSSVNQCKPKKPALKGTNGTA